LQLHVSFDFHNCNNLPLQHLPAGLYNGHRRCSLWTINWTFTRTTSLLEEYQSPQH